MPFYLNETLDRLRQAIYRLPRRDRIRMYYSEVFEIFYEEDYDRDFRVNERITLSYLSTTLGWYVGGDGLIIIPCAAAA